MKDYRQESKIKGNLGEEFIKSILELSGYKVMKFGIENHNQKIIQEIAGNYKLNTNRKLLSMPDLVVVDPESKESWLLEIKFRTFNEKFKMNSDEDNNLKFSYGNIKDYIDFWKDTSLILVFDVEPYCLCVDVNKIDWKYHLKGKFENNKGNFDELWNFAGEYKKIYEKFPRVTVEIFNRVLKLFNKN